MVLEQRLRVVLESTHRGHCRIDGIAIEDDNPQVEELAVELSHEHEVRVRQWPSIHAHWVPSRQPRQQPPSKGK